MFTRRIYTCKIPDGSQNSLSVSYVLLCDTRACIVESWGSVLLCSCLETACNPNPISDQRFVLTHTQDARVRDRSDMDITPFTTALLEKRIRIWSMPTPSITHNVEFMSFWNPESVARKAGAPRRRLRLLPYNHIGPCTAKKCICSSTSELQTCTASLPATVL